MKFGQIHRGGLLLLALGLSACGGSGGTAITTTTVQGVDTQGPVSGAVVFADRLNSGTRSVKDADELSFTTTGTGSYTLNIPSNYGDYVLVSQGGTDTIANKPAMQMMAPAGSKNVTPLTTLVALTPPAQQAAVKALILATGITSFDADVSINATPAALLLTKSIEIAVDTLGKSIAGAGVTLTDAQLHDVQEKTMRQIAIAAAAQQSLLSTADLKTVISTGVAAALPTLTNVGVTVADDAATQAVATAVAETVTTVATSLGNPSGILDKTGTASEATTFTQDKLNSINEAVNAQASTAGSSVTVHPTAVNAGASLSGIAITGPVVVAFNAAIDFATITNTTFTVQAGSSAAVAGTFSYDSATKKVTYTPSADLAFGTTYTVTLTSGIKDTQGVTLVPATFTFATVPLSGTGGGPNAGTGANF